MSGEADDLDLLAGEYALGCLDAAEMHALEAQAAGNVDLQLSIQRWVGRLGPLALAARPMAPPPSLWTRLAGSVGDISGIPAIVVTPDATLPPSPSATVAAPPSPPVATFPPARDPAVPAAPAPVPVPPAAITAAPPAPTTTATAAATSASPAAADPATVNSVMPDNVMPLRAPRPAMPSRSLLASVGFWRATTAAGFAIAAGLAAFFVNTAPTASVPFYLAALTPPGAPAAGFFARSQPDGSILVVALNAPPPVPNRDMELWALPQGTTRPISLGVMQGSSKRVAAASIPRDQTQLMISLEPAGGSPTGQPTGPVLFAGRLSGAS